MSSDPSSSHDDLTNLKSEFSRLRCDVVELRKRLERVESAAGVEVSPPILVEISPAEAEARRQARLATQPVTPAARTAAARTIPAAAASAASVAAAAPATATVAVPTAKAGEERLFKSKSIHRAAEPADRITWEAVLAGQWLTWLGAGVLILAVGFSIHWAWMTFDTPPWLQVLAFHALGAGLLAGGHVLNRRGTPIAARALAGLGIFTLYAAAFAAFRLYNPPLWSSPMAFVECACITALAILLAVRTDSAAIVLLGGLGGYLTPLLTSSGAGDHVALFGYLAFLNIALVGCATWKPWSFLKPLSLVATALMFLLWLNNGYQEASHLWSTQWLLVVHLAIFLCGATLPPCVWRRPSSYADLAALSGGSLWFMGMTWLLFHDRPTQQLALVSWSLAALHAVLFAVTYARVSNEDRMPRIHLALAAVFVTLAAPLQIDDPRYFALTWCVEGFIFSAIGVYFRDRQMQVSACIAFLLGVLRLFALDASAGEPLLPSLVSLDSRFALISVAGALLLAAGGLYYVLPRRGDATAEHTTAEHAAWDKQLSASLLAAGNIVILLGMTRQWDNRLVLILWTIDAAAIWAAGFFFDRQALRSYGLFLALAFAGSRACFDFARLDEPFTLLANSRFVSLVALAATYFVAGWLYQGVQRRNPPASPARSTDAGVLALSESMLPQLLGVLASIVLLAAVTWELDGWFTRAISLQQTPFADMRMARLAGYSIVWAIYAALLVVAGFAARYPTLRIVGLVGFLPIVLKVFFIDLMHLNLLPRVLALAVLGVMLLGVSFLYQKFKARLAGATSHA